MFFNLLDTKNLGHAKATAGRKGNSGIAWHCTAIPISFLVLPIRPIENFTTLNDYDHHISVNEFNQMM